MQKLTSVLPYIVAGAGAWAVLNGILHDVFVLTSEHGRQYNRNLLRLLMDGHILITCGVVLLFCFKGVQAGELFTSCIAITACVSLLVYCAMIFPFLKSIGMMAVQFCTLILLIFKITLTK